MHSREWAEALLHEYTQSEALRLHAVAVESSMRRMARHYGEDEELWGLVGLLHDFDYERWPDLAEHTNRGAEILRERGVDEQVIYAILAHNDFNQLPRDSLLDRALYAVDELSGFVYAAALVRPNRDVSTMEVKSIKKKLKDKAFARAVNRDEIRHGAEQLGLPLDELIALVIEAARENAPALQLNV